MAILNRLLSILVMRCGVLGSPACGIFAWGVMGGVVIIWYYSWPKVLIFARG